MLPITGCAMLVVINPAGPVHTVFTVTGTSTDGLNSTVQVRMTELPTVMMPDGLLVILTVGVGTKPKENSISKNAQIIYN